MNAQSHVAISADGVPIHYDVRGSGAVALVFVHGWCGNRRFWDRQVGHFPHQTVVTLDLAGHGESGRERTRWTMPAFGQDVAAVVEQLGLDQVVLVGHSMGGAVIIEAARHLPAASIGLVGIETWHDLEQALVALAQIAEFMAPFRAHYVETMSAFMRNMFLPTSDATLVEEVLAAVLTIPPDIAIAVAEETLAYDDLRREGLRAIQVRKIAINSRDWQYLKTNVEAAQRCGIEVMWMSGVGHISMMEDPQTCNRLLGEAVQKIICIGASQ